MIKLLADENFDNRIIRGLQRKKPDVDIVRVQDTDVYQADDPTVLEWAAQENRVLLTHDVNTIPKFAYERIADGQAMTGVVAVKATAATGTVIDGVILLLDTSDDDAMENQVLYLPL